MAVIASATPLLYIDDDWRTGPVDTSVAAYHQQEVDGSLPPGATVSNEFLPKHTLVLPGVTAELLTAGGIKVYGESKLEKLL